MGFVFAVLVLFGGRIASGGLGSEEYVLPLVGPYAVYRTDPEYIDPAHGRYQLVEIANATSTGTSMQFMVDKLKRFLVNGQIISGSTETGFFILDTSKPESTAQMYSDEQRWRAALAVVGTPPDAVLSDPDVIAVTMTDRQIHPFHYRVMKGLFGQPDVVWQGVVFAIGFVLIFFNGIRVREGSPSLWLAITVGWATSIAFILLDPDQSRVFVGFVAYPFLFWLVGLLGRFAGRVFRKLMQHTNDVAAVA